MSHSCDSMAGSPLGSYAQGTFPDKNTEWVSISFSWESSWPKDLNHDYCNAGSLLHCRWILYQLSHKGSLKPARLLCPWISPGKNTGVGSHSFLQGIFLIQGLNPSLLHCRQILYSLSHQGSPIVPLEHNRLKTSESCLSKQDFLPAQISLQVLKFK